ncbi:hypothetical protein [Streptomyces sp. 8N616]|uniref:hypothetical protein n=1 Tax=Streptomyces sp. 8N616 TaxID=3457414 RepID=UPI003FD0B323
MTWLRNRRSGAPTPWPTPRWTPLNGSNMRRQDGTRRDSLYYSLLADEWPAVRDVLRARVAAKTTA